MPDYIRTESSVPVRYTDIQKKWEEQKRNNAGGSPAHPQAKAYWFETMKAANRDSILRAAGNTTRWTGCRPYRTAHSTKTSRTGSRSSQTPGFCRIWVLQQRKWCEVVLDPGRRSDRILQLGIFGEIGRKIGRIFMPNSCLNFVPLSGPCGPHSGPYGPNQYL